MVFISKKNILLKYWLCTRLLVRISCNFSFLFVSVINVPYSITFPRSVCDWMEEQVVSKQKYITRIFPPTSKKGNIDNCYARVLAEKYQSSISTRSVEKELGSLTICNSYKLQVFYKQIHAYVLYL